MIVAPVYYAAAVVIAPFATLMAFVGIWTFIAAWKRVSTLELVTVSSVAVLYISISIVVWGIIFGLIVITPATLL